MKTALVFCWFTVNFFFVASLFCCDSVWLFVVFFWVLFFHSLSILTENQLLPKRHTKTEMQKIERKRKEARFVCGFVCFVLLVINSSFFLKFFLGELIWVPTGDKSNSSLFHQLQVYSYFCSAVEKCTVFGIYARIYVPFRSRSLCLSLFRSLAISFHFTLVCLSLVKTQSQIIRTLTHTPKSTKSQNVFLFSPFFLLFFHKNSKTRRCVFHWPIHL